MPIIVDREQIRTDILMAFERCIERKPMLSVSLRGMPSCSTILKAKTTSSSPMCATRANI